LNEEEAEGDSGEQHGEMGGNSDWTNTTHRKLTNSLAAVGDHIKESAREMGPGVRLCARCNTRSRTEAEDVG